MQLVSAPDCGSGCRGFESHYPPFSFIFILACSIRYESLMGYRQAVRHRTLTPAFAGSNPASPVYLGSRERKYGRVAQVVEHLTFNQVVRGSNPRTLTDGTGQECRIYAAFLFFIFLSAGNWVSPNYMNYIRKRAVSCAALSGGYGGIGRRARFRIWCPRRAGSSPVIRI